MNKILNLMQAARDASASSRTLYSDHMRSEFLTLHQEMVMQLRFEQLRDARHYDFFAGMIAQHDRAAALLRASLDDREPELIETGLAHAETIHAQNL